MVRFEIKADNPAVLTIHDFQDSLEEIRESLTYRDLKANYVYMRFKKNRYLRDRMGDEKYEAHLADLHSQVKKSLLTIEGDRATTYAGLAGYLTKKTGIPVENSVTYPKGGSIPWHRDPLFEPYPFQELSEKKLIEAKHARIECGTGLGKTEVAIRILRNLGLQAVVMAPNTSIAEQIHIELVARLGAKYVGAYFDKKKDFKKLITVGNAQSLTRIKPDSPAWEKLSKAQVFIADESHQCPASTLDAVCMGLCVGAPYRFFFSATQLRQDGLGLLLDGITGPTVFSMTVAEGVAKGYLAKPIFHMLKARSTSPVMSSDANTMTREHLYYNPSVIARVGSLVNAAATHGFPVLVLVREVEQFTKLLPYLKHKVAFAHGALGEDNVDKVPEEYRESEPNKLVKDFNTGKLPILVGTSCISTGTDVKSVKFLVYLKGGKSEIDVRQGIGRGTRLFPGKTKCHVVDIDVRVDGLDPREDPLHRHAEARREIYEDVGGPVLEMV
jgi:superfamily II DNA or RNA helicase